LDCEDEGKVKKEIADDVKGFFKAVIIIVKIE
jgi:hypothetical protein